MWNNEGNVEIRSASIWENGELELIGEVEMTGVEKGVDRPTGLAALDAGDSALLLAECAVKVTWPDGDVGYGHLERGYRRNLLTDLVG